MNKEKTIKVIIIQNGTVLEIQNDLSGTSLGVLCVSLETF